MDDLFTVIIVLVSSAIAVGLLVLLNMLIGGWSRALFTDGQAAGRAMGEAVLGFEPESVQLDAERRAALALEDNGHRLGLAVCRGDKVIVRALRPGELTAVERDGVVLTLKLADFTFPVARFRLSDEQLARRWAETASLFARGAQRDQEEGMRHV